MDVAKYSLDGKVALVTGGSRGIGRAIALAFADAGADVVITARKEPGLQEAAEEIRTRGRKVLAVPAHIAKIEDSKNLVEKIKAEFGRVDVLVNNAGTNVYLGPLIDVEEWAWDVPMNVNVKGPFFLSQMVARMMQEQGGGNIINIASREGITPGGLHIYGVSKAALIMLTQYMAKEWGKYNIRVNVIAPGMVKTGFSEPLWREPAAHDAIARSTALGRLAEADEIASVALFLASEASSYVSGATIVVGGG